MNHPTEIFCFHLLKLPLQKVPFFLMKGPGRVPGLLHSERFLTMNLGASIASSSRYNFRTVAAFSWWKDEHFLENSLNLPAALSNSDGWQVRMKLYRRWGHITELENAVVSPELAKPEQPIVAVTLARLNILQTGRFIRWGKPVEKQVRDHSGQLLALAAIRPINTFSTFSLWKNESEMINMVHGRSHNDGESHKQAMQERNRKDFHHEFTTMRFVPIKEIGTWNGKSNYLSL